LLGEINSWTGTADSRISKNSSSDSLSASRAPPTHLANSIWPERVAKACEKDRSLAIAHSLEHLCKVEPPKAKKKAKSKAAAAEVEVYPELIEDL